MAFSLYKPGQGYWMRVVTASMLAAIVLASAMWFASETKRVAVKLPDSSYTMQVNAVSGTPTPGQVVTMLAVRGLDGVQPPIGSATVASFDSNSGELVLTKPEITDSKKHDLTEIDSVRTAAEEGSGAFRASVSGTPIGQKMIEPLLLQGIVASVVIALGALFAYWLCAARPSTVDFLIATDMEMKKVNWSTRKDVIASTWVVIGAAVIIAFVIFGVDVALQALFRFIGVLRT